MIPPQVEWALTLWSTITASTIEAKLPTTMKKVNLKNKSELVRSTLFDKVTWGAATNGYIASCGNIKPKGWITIEREVMAFVRVYSHHTVSILLGNIGTSTQVNDEHGNLVKDSDDTDNEEEVPHNGVQGIIQGDEMSSNSEDMEEALPHNRVWGITQGDELPSDSEGGSMASSNNDSE